MSGRTLTVACGIGMLLMTVLLIGAEPAPPRPRPCRCNGNTGCISSRPAISNGTWQPTTSGPRTRHSSSSGWASRPDIEVSARTGRIQPLLVNHLGQQGWELVEVAVDARRDVYWFKRPK